MLGGTDDEGRGGKADGTLEVLGCLLKHGAWSTPRQISLVVSQAGFERSRKCFLDAICRATNPLLVGMTLSIQLADAADLGNEGQRRVRYFDPTLEGVWFLGPGRSCWLCGCFMMKS